MIILMIVIIHHIKKLALMRTGDARKANIPRWVHSLNKCLDGPPVLALKRAFLWTQYNLIFIKHIWRPVLEDLVINISETSGIFGADWNQIGFVNNKVVIYETTWIFLKFVDFLFWPNLQWLVSVCLMKIQEGHGKGSIYKAMLYSWECRPVGMLSMGL